MFEVWIKKEKVEKNLGTGPGLKVHLYAILLASLTVGGIYVALPFAHTLFKKGADLEVVFTYVGTSGAVKDTYDPFRGIIYGIRIRYLAKIISLASYYFKLNYT